MHPAAGSHIWPPLHSHTMQVPLLPAFGLKVPASHAAERGKRYQRSGVTAAAQISVVFTLVQMPDLCCVSTT